MHREGQSTSPHHLHPQPGAQAAWCCWKSSPRLRPRAPSPQFFYHSKTLDVQEASLEGRDFRKPNSFIHLPDTEP